MADLYQSDFETIRLRRSVEDGENLIALLKEDGAITVVPDPAQSEVEAAQQELASRAEAKAVEGAEEAEADAEEQKEIAALTRLASFVPPVTPEIEEAEEEEQPRRGRNKIEAEEE